MQQKYHAFLAENSTHLLFHENVLDRSDCKPTAETWQQPTIIISQQSINIVMIRQQVFKVMWQRAALPTANGFVDDIQYPTHGNLEPQESVQQTASRLVHPLLNSLPVCWNRSLVSLRSWVWICLILMPSNIWFLGPHQYATLPPKWHLHPFIDWVKVLHPTRHKIGHFWDVLLSHSIRLVLKNENKHSKSKQASVRNKIYYNTK